MNALMLMLLTGCLCGFANGVMISATKVVPFIVTLGTMTIFLGIGQIISGESTVYAPKENIPDWLSLCYTGSDSEKYLIPKDTHERFSRNHLGRWRCYHDALHRFRTECLRDRVQ